MIEINEIILLFTLGTSIISSCVCMYYCCKNNNNHNRVELNSIYPTNNIRLQETQL
jgi:hypothetical protein